MQNFGEGWPLTAGPLIYKRAHCFQLLRGRLALHAVVCGQNDKSRTRLIRLALFSARQI